MHIETEVWALGTFLLWTELRNTHAALTHGEFWKSGVKADASKFHPNIVGLLLFHICTSENSGSQRINIFNHLPTHITQNSFRIAM